MKSSRLKVDGTKVQVNDVVDWYKQKLSQKLDDLERADRACFQPLQVYNKVYMEVEKTRKKLLAAQVKQKMWSVLSFVVSKFKKEKEMKKITQKQLDEILKGSSKIILKDCDLRGLDFRGADLSKADLSGSDASFSNMKGCRLPEGKRCPFWQVGDIRGGNVYQFKMGESS